MGINPQTGATRDVHEPAADARAARRETTLPWRWARNSALLAAFTCFLPLVGTTAHIGHIIRNSGLFWMSLGAVFLALPTALLFGLIRVVKSGL